LQKSGHARKVKKMTSPWRAATVLSAFWFTLHCISMPARAASENEAKDAKSPGALVAEVRHSFTLHGKVIPPEIFRDLGDGDMADSTSIWVTVDIEAAIDSNLYADVIKEYQGWHIQTKATQDTNDGDETAYRFIGSTSNGLLVVIASYNGGGTGTFYTLHILDIAAARAFDLDGKLYPRINLTSLRSVVLGDRWDGDVSISKNSIRIVTTRRGPADDGAGTTTTITAERP
jgi:hypothetical protein